MAEPPDNDTETNADPLAALSPGTLESLLRRAHTTSGHCAIGILGVGGISRPFKSYDPVRVIAAVSQITGSTPRPETGAPTTDGRDWFTLTKQQVERILAAPNRGLVPMDIDISAPGPQASRFAEGDVIAFAAVEVVFLLNELHLLGVYPPSAKRPPTTGAERLVKAARKLKDMLAKTETDRLIGDWPDLAGLRAGIDDLNLLSTMTAEARAAEDRRAKQRALEVFIRDRLAPCFEGIFQHKAGVSRPGAGQGPPDGPFVRFAMAFFGEIGLPVQAETVARHLNRTPTEE